MKPFVPASWILPSRTKRLLLYECRKKGVSLDTAGANLVLKRGHIAAFDVSCREEEGREFKSAEEAIASLERLCHMTRRYSPQEIWEDFEKRRAR